MDWLEIVSSKDLITTFVYNVNNSDPTAQQLTIYLPRHTKDDPRKIVCFDVFSNIAVSKSCTEHDLPNDSKINMVKQREDEPRCQCPKSSNGVCSLSKRHRNVPDNNNDSDVVDRSLVLESAANKDNMQQCTEP